MDFRRFFEQIDSDWVRYSKYEFSSAGDAEYLTPTGDSEITVYNPLEVIEAIIADAINIGRGFCNDRTKAGAKDEILDFARKYGLLGFMTALTTNEEFFGKSINA